MANYLDQYGAGEAKRENLVRNVILIGLSAVILGALVIYLFHTFHEVRVAKHFLSLVRDKNYPAAYQAWGCSSPQACPGYSYDKFLEDWGPKSPAGDSVPRITDSEGCGSGVLLSVEVNPSDMAKLWVEKNGDSLGFSPVNVCPGKGPWTIMIHRTVGRLRRIYF